MDSVSKDVDKSKNLCDTNIILNSDLVQAQKVVIGL
jgi:hypothetical protein